VNPYFETVFGGHTRSFQVEGNSMLLVMDGALLIYLSLLNRHFTKDVCLAWLPRNGTLIHIQEFKEFVEIRRAPNHLVEHQI
jgi:hypothetical protein